ncbi:hypothetical protein [Paenibacillus sp. FSL R7-0331]|uniref:hypothetical protein n=1 Tax=Paenibacillus sp. FSL R7-0331 TaxID=1536773 RepID=UPI0004F8D5F0|nr:hypothetical protein [Paenibacillus sp. FSL R7-0331]AIQ51549.1 hypothetical protein R70331_08510 [Paenibacillus sp. FSL R7-0331]
MKQSVINVMLCFILIAAVVTMHDVFPGFSYRVPFTLVLALGVLYIFSKAGIQKPASYKGISLLFLSLFVFTCVYHTALSAITGNGLFDNSYWIFLCVINVLAWLRMRFTFKGNSGAAS